MPLPLQSLLLLLLFSFEPIVGDLKFCPLEHIEVYGDDIANLYPVDNATDCEERCFNTPDCQVFAFREIQKECILMKDFLGYTKKNAWKVTSGYLIDENVDPKHDNYTTCSGGGGLVRILEF